MCESNIKIGQRFGRLVVVRQVPSQKGDRKRKFECVCDCGKTKVIVSVSLTTGHTRSCGCMQKENFPAAGTAALTTHGMTGSPEYTSWAELKQRCSNPNRAHYALYGGRGITVCDRWRDSFENFLADMGPKPGPEYSVDRANPNGNYEPENCSWKTPTQQARNRRSTRWIACNGSTKSLAEWAEITGINRGTIQWRLDRLNQTPAQALGLG